MPYIPHSLSDPSVQLNIILWWYGMCWCVCSLISQAFNGRALRIQKKVYLYFAAVGSIKNGGVGGKSNVDYLLGCIMLSGNASYLCLLLAYGEQQSHFTPAQQVSQWLLLVSHPDLF